MTKPRILPSLILIAVLLASCAPAASPTTSAVDAAPSATLPPASPPEDIPSQATVVPLETLEPTPLPIATSRGPDLHATDPGTVALASGGLQLVEFFRFT